MKFDEHIGSYSVEQFLLHGFMPQTSSGAIVNILPSLAAKQRSRENEQSFLKY